MLSNIGRRTSCLLPLSVGIALYALPSRRVEAGCYENLYSVGDYWDYSEFPRTVIPVYVNTSGTHSVSAATGFTNDQVIDVVQSAIQRWNETSAASPTLEYAGTESGNTTLNANRFAFSITVQGTTCAEVTDHGCDGSSGDWAACHESDVNGSKSLITLHPMGCAVNSVPSWSLGHVSTSLNAVLIHEFGHALGLAHNDEGCGGANQTEVGNGDNARGVMEVNVFNTHQYWTPWRDDIETLRELWGLEDLDVHFEESTDNGASWSTSHPDGIHTQVAPALGSSAFATEEIRSIAYVTGTANYVYLKTGSWSSWNAAQLVDVLNSGTTWDSPSVAQGRTSGNEGRMMVAWTANETQTAFDADLRVATRAYGSSTYTYNTVVDDIGANGLSKAFALGFDDFNRRFIVAQIDSQGDIVVKSLNPSTGAVVGSSEFTEAVWGVDAVDIGNPACYSSGGQTWCAILFAGRNGSYTNAIGWLEVSPLANGTFSGIDVDYHDLDHDGAHLSFHVDQRAAGSLGFLGGYGDQNTSIGYSFKVAKANGTFGNAITANPVYVAGWAWDDEFVPIGWGLMTRVAAPQLKLMRAWAHF